MSELSSEPFPPFRPSARPDAVERAEAVRRSGERNARPLGWLAIATAAGLFVAAVVLPTGDGRTGAIVMCFNTLLFLLPAWAFAAWERRATGRPAQFFLIEPNARFQREFERILKGRPRMSDAAYHEAFFAGTDLPPDWPARALRSIEIGLGLDNRELNALHPRDELVYIDLEVDWADVLFRLKREFDLSRSLMSLDGWDRTFDGLLRLLSESNAESERRNELSPGGPLM
ncbi:hypothetical protein [Alienimonas chondri]|uniref:Acyl carrier protein n=1 Tax=Alienimonas chondri TaxID=2681879 RepID=A0ABX1VG62_9PLAN|nr:hypothetical protein [Alienimonas chondri]NNJ27114.1 hypothetical protein [Alienimonas chondri]